MIIIVESPKKAKKVESVLGCRCIATGGHFCDLPKDALGIDINNGFKPTFTLQENGKELIRKLKQVPPGEEVVIATDPDREGFAIGMFVYRHLPKNIKASRAEFRSYEEKDLKASLAARIPFNKTNFAMFDAFIARRLSDRLIGYSLSPLASRALNDKTPYSVGRVQSPAVRMVVDVERQIRNFTPQTFYTVHAIAEKNGIRFELKSARGRIMSAKEAEDVRRAIQGDIRITGSVVKTITRNPPPPLTTVEMQALASSRLSLSPGVCMTLAQDLFEAGLCTYHRTDSVRLVPQVVDDIRNLIAASFGREYLPPKPFSHQSRNTQADAHEAIRPTVPHRREDIPSLIAKNNLTPRHAGLYTLIWDRAVASQMEPAKYESTRITARCGQETLIASGHVIVFPGFTSLFPPDTAKDEEQQLPRVSEGDTLPIIETVCREGKTKPPQRYTEATLVKALEKKGIGRPSTYAFIMDAITSRKYVDEKARKLVATTRGEKLHDFLAQKAPWLIEYDMTAHMEENLDRIEAGRMSPNEFLQLIWEKINPIQENTMRAPTEKQVEYAETISRTIAVPIPPEARESSQTLATWIDTHKERFLKAPLPPTQKQIEYAKSIAAAKGVSIPPDALSSMQLLSGWIDANKNDMLSEKQLYVIKKHAPPQVVEAVEKGDAARGRKFLEEYFATKR